MCDCWFIYSEERKSWVCISCKISVSDEFASSHNINKHNNMVSDLCLESSQFEGRLARIQTKIKEMFEID